MSQTKAQLIDNLVSPITGALGSASAPTFSFTADPNTGIYSPGADQLAISTGGSGRLFVDASGNVGVGTNSPLALYRSLSVAGPATDEGGVFETRTSNSSTVGYFFSDSGGVFLQTATAHPLTFRTNNTERLRITSAGLVGMGTSSPSTLLHLSGLNSGGGSANTIRVTDTDTAVITDQICGRIEFETADTGNPGVNCQIDALYSGSGGGSKLQFRTGFAGALVDALHISDTGLVGIGTTSPGYQLVVKGAASSTLQILSNGTTNFSRLFFGDDNDLARGFINYDHSDDSMRFGTNNAERARIDSSGRVGIGTSSPTNVKLEVKESATNTVGTGHIGFSGASTPLWVWRLSSPDADLNLDRYSGGWSSTPALTVNRSTGNVGIGTTPETTLDVNGAITLRPVSIPGTGKARIYERDADNKLYIQTGTGNAIRFLNSSQTDLLNIDSSGRLLVGTSSSPSLTDGQYSKLHVIGNSNSATGNGFINIGRGLAASGALAGGTGLGVLQFTDNAGAVHAAISGDTDATTGTNDYPGRLVFSTTADGASSPTERMRIDKDGRLYLRSTGQTSNSTVRFDMTFTGGNSEYGIAMNANSLSNGTQYIGFNILTTQYGSISWNGSAIAYNTSSDYRLKENIVSLTGAADRLKHLQVCRFNFISNPDTTVDGFIAHEAQAVVPECVTGEKDAVDDDGNPVYQGIDQSKLVPLLTAALQEAIGRIETLEGMVAVNNITIDEQQHQLSTLAARLTALESA
jgi:hypothetical protein